MRLKPHIDENGVLSGVLHLEGMPQSEPIPLDITDVIMWLNATTHVITRGFANDHREQHIPEADQPGAGPSPEQRESVVAGGDSVHGRGRPSKRRGKRRAKRGGQSDPDQGSGATGKISVVR